MRKKNKGTERERAKGRGVGDARGCSTRIMQLWRCKDFLPPLLSLSAFPNQLPFYTLEFLHTFLSSLVVIFCAFRPCHFVSLGPNPHLCFFSCSPLFSLASLMCGHPHPHPYTHTYIYIYVYIYIPCLIPSLAIIYVPLPSPTHD